MKDVVICMWKCGRILYFCWVGNVIIFFLKGDVLIKVVYNVKLEGNILWFVNFCILFGDSLLLFVDCF